MRCSISALELGSLWRCDINSLLQQRIGYAPAVLELSSRSRRWSAWWGFTPRYLVIKRLRRVGDGNDAVLHMCTPSG